MINFYGNESTILYHAVRYYQLNKTTTGSKEYWKCDELLRKLHPHVSVNGVEPGFRSDT
jgi:hypothetical protein